MNEQKRPVRCHQSFAVRRLLLAHAHAVTHARNLAPANATMAIAIGSYVQINEQSRNRAIRGLFGRVQALRSRGTVRYAQVSVLGLDEHIQGDTPVWWMPCLVLHCLGEEATCIDPGDAEAAARPFLPFLFMGASTSTEAIEASVEPLPPASVRRELIRVKDRLRQASGLGQSRSRPNGPLGRPLANGVTPRRDASVPHAATGAVVLHAIPVI